MAKKIIERVVFDTGPAERRQHNRVVVERTASHRARLRVVDQTEVDRLLLLRHIDLDQHSAAEHLSRDIQNAGYFPACKWSLESNIRGDVQTISACRADALLKIGLARAWLLKRAGRKITEFLFGVILGERRVTDQQVPIIRLALNKYQAFESWWHGRSTRVPLPSLLADLPGDIQKSRPFHHQER